MGSRRGHSFILGLQTTIFEAEGHAIKACVMKNTEKSHKGKNICVLSDSQVAVKARDSFQTHALKNILHLHDNQQTYIYTHVPSRDFILHPHVLVTSVTINRKTTEKIKCNILQFNHTFLYNYLHNDCIFVVAHPDDGHGRYQNTLNNNNNNNK